MGRVDTQTFGNLRSAVPHSNTGKHVHRLAAWRPILDSFDIDVALFDADARYVYVNPQAVRDPAVRAAIIGMTDLEYVAYRGVPTEIGERRYDAVRRVIATGEILRFEETLRARSGELRQLVRRICPVRGESGTITGAIGYGYDVTDVRETQRALRENQLELQASARQAQEAAARFALVARATNDVVWDWDLVTNGLWWNEAMQIVFGHTPDALGDSIDGWTRHLHPEDLERVIHGIHAAIEGTEPGWEDEYRFRKADGSYATVLDRGYILRDEQGAATRMIGSMQDITRRQELEHQLRHAQKMEAVGQLAAGVAHDFNNILTAISAYSELMLRDVPADWEHRDDILEIQNAAVRATALTRQLLSFSRKELVRPRVLDLNDIVRENVLLLRRAIGDDVALVLHLAEGRCDVVADGHQVGQVLMNLAINARDAMRARGGRATISTSRVTAASLGSRLRRPRATWYAHLAVQDTGEGMDAVTLSRIFEPFFTTKDVGEGTGLGLATVYGIVRQSDGEVWAESTPGEGSTFHVVLPLAESAREEHQHGGSVAVAGVHSSGTVLLVEDEPAVRESIARGLRRQGYSVIQSADATEAMRLWDERGGVDLIVTDVVMPGLRGPDMVKLLRRERGELPVVFMSGYPADALDAEELALPHTAFLVKPFQLDELATALAKVRAG